MRIDVDDAFKNETDQTRLFTLVERREKENYITRCIL